MAYRCIAGFPVPSYWQITGYDRSGIPTLGCITGRLTQYQCLPDNDNIRANQHIQNICPPKYECICILVNGIMGRMIDFPSLINAYRMLHRLQMFIFMH